VDGEVVVRGPSIVFWCATCQKWIDAYIEVDAAKIVHSEIADH
jgi:hypothetical protein